MSRVGANIIANYLGQGWASLMSIAFVPLYIRYLGMESFGLIGFFAVMQAWLPLIDMGITPTLNREMARFTAGAHTAQSIRNLLRSLEVVCFSLAGLITLAVWSASGYLAHTWIRNQQLPDEVVAQAIAIFAVVLALRLCEGIYRGALIGLQRQIWFNSVNAGLATLRHGGVVLLLAWGFPTIQAFFIWQGVSSLITVCVFAIKLYRSLPETTCPASISRRALTEVRHFASGMVGITFLALLLTQVDKLLLARLLPLATFGYYALAATIAGVVFMLVGPITQSVYPRMVELVTMDDRESLITIYHQSAQIVTALTAPVVLLLVFFAKGIVFMWSGDVHLAENAAPILSVLVVGTFLNGLMHIPYLLQIAHGWTRLAIQVNTVAVMILVPAILWLVPIYGPVGAAWIWVALNSGYVIVAVQLMHRRLIPSEKRRWYFADVLPPIITCLSVMLMANLIQPNSYENRISWLGFLFFVGSIGLVGSSLSSNLLRARLLSMAGIGLTHLKRKV
ncbi:lipopolysaccharide biosynthesis protein [Desulfosudis oleivorans]|uniref:Polysaccharide biosynthesis protein n=1 Tax=Desulfosudis oleivorans (strain DSM 6200 / JCM 39069 / Hxd3) TaxID=96561 RepID=A8ZT87_DESOH|nr:oligosaccharide flippase family protein [Desulfosudis oleivorans]ABW67770.1 polysaccharide biosynthesis protein [Desulfosudis oleivorans Hxd3]